jgi:uncharacterized SAM-binding protein YcdF (DUF218 family)
MLESWRYAQYSRRSDPGSQALRVNPMVSPIRLVRIFGWLVAVVIVIAICALLWGGDLLIAGDSLPAHVDVAIALQGSMVAEKVRIAGAMDLLRQGVAGRVLLSVPKESYWGQSMPPVARAYLERNYGRDLAASVDFCETSADVNSTEEEAQAATVCIQEHHWHSILVVTSNYHTRRAGMLWRRVIRHDPNIHVWIHGVLDPEFQQPWWRHRQSAKIWVMECSKLTWALLG